jgi:hypothetical protein
VADEVVRRYTVGDEIHLNVRVGHNMNLTGLRVVFTHVRDPDIEFEFWGEESSGDIEKEDPQGTGSQQSPEDRLHTSSARLVEELTIEHVSGRYRFGYVKATTAAGRTVRNDNTIDLEEGDRDFKITSEPNRLSILDIKMEPYQHEALG